MHAASRAHFHPIISSDLFKINFCPGEASDRGCGNQFSSPLRCWEVADLCRSVTALMQPQPRGGALEANRTLKESWLRGPCIRNPPCSSLSRARRSCSAVSAIHRRKILLFPRGGAGALNFDSTNFSPRGPGQVPFDGCSPRPSIPPRIGVFSEQITPLCFQAGPPRLNLPLPGKATARRERC